jgi:hypothetical protein
LRFACGQNAPKKRAQETRRAMHCKRFGTGAMTHAFAMSAGARPMSDADAPPVAGIFAGNILRLSLRDRRWAVHWNDKLLGFEPGVQKREKPRPWQSQVLGLR